MKSKPYSIDILMVVEPCDIELLNGPKQDDILAFNMIYHCYSKSLYVYLLDKLIAYDIACKNLASKVSFSKAIFAAIHIVKHRRETVELHENPLAIAKLSRNRD